MPAVELHHQSPKTRLLKYEVIFGQVLSILESLWRHYSSRGTAEPCILLHGTRSKPHGLLDHGLIYGDYYFVEALTTVKNEA
jgi:hypothetical protein